MGGRSAIEWTDATWQVTHGCSLVSPGCTNCYAMRVAGTRLKTLPQYAGLTREVNGAPVWTGGVRVAEDRTFTQPLRWRRPRKIFVNSLSDLFHPAVPDATLINTFALMAACPQHIFQVVTKRAKRMRHFLSDPATVEKVWFLAFQYQPRTTELANLRDQAAGAGWPLPNVWMLVSVEDQARADERIPDLLATPAAVRGISAEPLLGRINLCHIQAPACFTGDDVDGWTFNALARGDYYSFRDDRGFWEGGDGPQRDHRIDWVIAGGESGPGARPAHPDWFRLLQGQCADAAVPFFFKQWGEWLPATRSLDCPTLFHPPFLGAAWREGPHDRTTRVGDDDHLCYRVGKKAAGAVLDGREHREFP